MEPGSELEPRPVDEPAEATRASPDAGDEADDDSLTPAEKRLLVILGIGGLVVLLIVLAVNMLSGDDKAEPSNQAEPTETIAAGPDPGSFASGGGILDRPAATVPTNTPR